MTTTLVDTSTTNLASGYSNARYVARTSNGVIWVALDNGSEIEFWYSTDEGETFTQAAGTQSRGTSTGQYSFFIDEDDYAHLAVENSTTNYTRGTPNAGRTAWTWASQISLTGSDASYTNPDVVAHREGTGWRAHVIMQYVGDGGTSVHYKRVAITSTGSLSIENTTSLGGTYGNNGDHFVTIDFHHTGDGKTIKDGVPHLFLAWTAPNTTYGIRFKKATYSSGSWTWGPEREIQAGRYVSGHDAWLNCMWDGSRVLIAGWLHDGTAVRDLVLYERDLADTTTTTRVLLDNANASEYLHYGSATYDDVGNVTFFGVNQDEALGTYNLVSRRWVRATNTLEAEVVIDDGVGYGRPHTKRGYLGDKLEALYTDGTASPYSVYYYGAALNEVPNAPTLVYPINNTIFDRATAQQFDWTFSDPNAGDTQSAYELRYRLAGASTWAETIAGTTPNTFHDFAAGYFAAGDYEWQVRTADAQGAYGAWSASGFFTAANAPATPAITDPVGGQVIAANAYTIAWSAPTQQSYQVRRVADNAGAPDTATVYQDTGEVVSASARSRSMNFETNNRFEHVQVRIKNNSLWSAWATVRIQVSYTVPPTPTLVVTNQPSDGRNLITVTNPAPGGGEPAVIENYLWRRLVGGTWQRIEDGILPNGSYHDYTAAAKTVYEYKVTAVGDNGTSADSVAVQSTELALVGSWIHDPSDAPGTLDQFIYNDNGGDESWEVESAETYYAGRTHPVAEYGETEAFSVSVELAVEEDTGKMDALTELLQLKRVLCYRDSYGRKVFFAPSIYNMRRRRWGGRVPLDISAVDYDETV